MQLREYQPSDLAALRAIHAAQDFGYALPDLNNNPLFLTKIVLADDDSTPPCSGAACCATTPHREAGGANRAVGTGKIVGAVLLRLTAEAYLLLDPRAGTPRQRWQWLLALHEAARRDAWRRGLEDVHAWLPPPIARKFGRRLERLGWVRDDTWTPYCKRLGG